MCVCVVFCVILGDWRSIAFGTRIFPAYCTSLVMTLLLHTVRGYRRDLIRVKNKNRENEWIEWQMWWCVLDRPTANPAIIKFDTSPSIKNDCILCVHKQQQEKSLCKERERKNFGKRMDDWNISNSSRLSSEKRATPTIIIIMSLYLYLSYPFFSLFIVCLSSQSVGFLYSSLISYNKYSYIY